MPLVCFRKWQFESLDIPLYNSNPLDSKFSEVPGPRKGMKMIGFCGHQWPEAP